MGRLVYGYWDCPHCKSKGIRGDNRECPNCGNPRGSDIKFYMGENIEYVPADKAINKKPDWLCPYCDALNTATATECKGCGASRDESTKNYHDLHPTTVKQSIKNNVKPNVLPKQNTTGANGFNIVPRIVLLLFYVIALIIIAIMFFKPHTEEMTVSGFSWNRNIEIQHYVTVDESGWSMPPDARLHYTNWEYKESRSVLDHYETETRQVEKQRISGYETYIVGYRDLGNGMFEEQTAERPVYETYYETETYEKPIYRQEPVYATKYYYEYDTWKRKTILKTNGSNKTPYWHEVNLADNERVGSKTETYTVGLTDKKGRYYECDVSQTQWNELSIKDKVTAKKTRAQGVIAIEKS